MKPCNGCKYLVVWNGRGWCREVFGVSNAVYDPTSGAYRWERPMKYGLYFMDNTTERCRSEGMPCGPQRVLYEPSWLRRLFSFLFRG